MWIECEEGKIAIFAPHSEYFKAKKTLLDAFEGIEFEVDDIQFVPQTSVSLNAEEAGVMETLIDMLDYLEDVQNVYHNAG